VCYSDLPRRMDPSEFEKHERLEETHWWFEGRRRCIAAVLDAHVRSQAGRRILDVGCGTGGMFPMLARYGTVSGAEFSADARERAHRRFPDVEVSECALPDRLPDGPFELITAFDVVEHLDDPVASLRALGKRLAPGGQLVVTVPAFQFLWSQHDVVLQHRRRYSEPLLRQHLTGAGFQVSYLSFFNTGLFPAVAAARALGRITNGSGGGGGDSDLKALPGPLNTALTLFFGAEAHLLKRTRLQVGVSLIAVAEQA
jgi:SAM-dependent methyltransferase